MERRGGSARGGGGDQRDAKAPLRESETHTHAHTRGGMCASKPRSTEKTSADRDAAQRPHSTHSTTSLQPREKMHTRTHLSENPSQRSTAPFPPRRTRRLLSGPSHSPSSFPHHGHPLILSMTSRAIMRGNKRRGGEGGGGAGTKLRREQLWRRVASPPPPSFKSTPAHKMDKDHESKSVLLLSHMPTTQGRRCCVTETRRHLL